MNVGIIDLGVMGSAVASHLIEACDRHISLQLEIHAPKISLSATKQMMVPNPS